MTDFVKWIVPHTEPWLVEEAKARYGEPQRHYHTMTHIAEMCRAAGEFGYAVGNGTDFTSMRLAIILHDIVYDPTARDNEERSAEFVDRLVSPDIDREKVRAMILATKSHVVDEGDQLTKDFMDIDMAILASRRERYLEYARQIRKEYSHAPLDAYVTGRSTFLVSQLARGRIFYGEQLSTEAAHANMLVELTLLRENPTMFFGESG